MGVQGLWKLLEPAGRPVALETLQGKVLAVDVSIWLHQALYGVRDSEGQAVTNAHLLVLFNRMLKLLYYGIKPIFVFDGATPTLKLKTLASRQQRRFAARKQTQKVAEKLLKNYVKSAALGSALSSAPTVPRPLLTGEDVKEDLFILPPFPQGDCQVDQEPMTLAKVDHRPGEEEADEDVSLAPSVQEFYQDLSSLDIHSPSFAALPPEIQHELIAEKQRHDKEIKFRYLKEVPEEADSFSAFQLNRLMSRNQLSRKLDDLRQMMASSYSADVGGGGRGEREVETRRIVSKAGSHYVLVRHTPSQSESEGEWESDSQMSSTGSVEVKGGSSEVNGESSQVKGVSAGLQREVLSDQSEGLTEAAEVVLTEARTAETKGGSSEVKGENSQVTAEANLLLHQNQGTKDVQEDIHGSVGAPGPLLDAGGGSVCVEEEEEDIQEAIYASFQIGRRSQRSSNQFMENDGGQTRPLVVGGAVGVNMSEVVGGVVGGALKVNVSEVVGVAEDPAAPHGRGDVSAGENDCRAFLPPPAANSSEGLLSCRPPAEECEVDRGDATGHGTGQDGGVLCDWQGAGGGGGGGGEDEEVGLMSCSSSSEGEGEGEPLEKKRRLSVDENSLEQHTSGYTSDTEVGTAKNKVDQVGSEVDQEGRSEVDQEVRSEVDQEVRSEVEQEVRSEVEQEVRSEVDQEQLQFVQDIGEVGQEVLSQQLQRERQQLLEEGGQMARYASEVNSQDLLRLFGVPFITSPSEAESQCAWLDIHHPQVDGTITDDNDYLLFGGHRVYRHFFNQKQIAELYTDTDIQQCLGLSQDQLILLAFFTGSDYTEGVQGVGVVSAVEILRDFPGKGMEVLQKFRAWHEAGSQLTAADKRLTSRQRKLLQVPLPPSFPDEQVMKAYQHPVVDDSNEHFSWATPDMHDLQQYAVSRLGWSEKKAKDTLAPVFKRMNATKPSSLQSKLSSYFSQPHFMWQRPSIASRRVQNVVARLKAAAREVEDGTPPTTSTGGGVEGSMLELSESSSSEEEELGEAASSEAVLEPIISQPHVRGRGKKKGLLSTRSAAVDKASSGRGRGRGSGRRRGRGRGIRSGRGRGRGKGGGSDRGSGRSTSEDIDKNVDHCLQEIP